MMKIADRYILAFYLLLIAVIVVYRLNILGFGDAVSHVWPPFIVMMAVLSLLVFAYLAMKTFLYFKA